MKLNEAYPGKTWSRKSPEFNGGETVVGTIKECGYEPPEQGANPKIFVTFEGDEHNRRWYCGKEAADSVARAVGSDDTDDWVGRSLEMFVDPNVRNPRDPSSPGGVRARAVDKDDIPF